MELHWGANVGTRNKQVSAQVLVQAGKLREDVKHLKDNEEPNSQCAKVGTPL